jgi:hypothetical protein
MESLTLDFFGEKVSISKPKDLSFLRIMISEKFGFSDTDATEILIYFIKDNKKTYIINEEGYSNFKNLKLPTLYLDIEKNSRLYMSSLEKVKEETTKKSNDELKLYQDQLISINKQIDELRTKKMDLVRKINELIKKQKKEEELKKQEANENAFNKVKQILDNVVEKVKEVTNEYVFKRFEGQEQKEKKEQVENIKKLTKDAVKEINNLSKIVINQSNNLIGEINGDEDDKILLKGAARQLGANGSNVELCDDCENKNKHKLDHLSVRVVDPGVKVVYYGNKCKGCGKIIWDEEN